MPRLLLILSCLAALSVAAQPIHVGPEQRTALPDDGPAALLQWHPAVASDGRDFLVLWTDDRYSGVLAARVSGAGALLDATPIQLPLRGYASVAWSGSEYVVVVAGAYETSMMHIGRDGSILDVPRVLATRYAPVALSRTAVAVVLDDGHAVTAQTFDLRGEALGPAVAVPLPRGPLAMAIGSDGNDTFGMAFTVPGEGILFCTLSRSGALSPVQPTSESAPIITMTVAGAGGRFTVVWWIDGALHLQDIGGAHVSIPLASPPVIGNAASAGDELLLPMHTIGDDLDADVVLLRHRGGAAPELVPVANGEINEFEPAVASNGSKFLLVWCDQLNVVYDLTARDAKRAATQTRGRDIPRSAAMQQLAHGAIGGETTLLVWSEERDVVRPSLWAGRIDANGELLDGRGVPLSDRPAPGAEPQVAFDGHLFVVAWTERDAKQFVGTRVSLAGAVLDAQPFVIETMSVGAVTLGSDEAGRTAIVYVGGSELRMRVIGSDGAMTPAISLASTARAIAEPSVIFDGGAFLAAWTEYERNPDYCTGFRCPGPYLWSDVHAARVTDGVLHARTVLASTGRGDFYYVPRVLTTRNGPVIAYRHGIEFWIARIDEQLSATAARLTDHPAVGVIAGVPVVAWSDDAGFHFNALNDDLSRSSSEATFQAEDVWWWNTPLVSGPSFGWTLYLRKTSDAEYGAVPRTFARKVWFGSRRARPLRR